MTAQKQLKRLAITASAGLLSLTASFNNSSFADIVPISAPLDTRVLRQDHTIPDMQVRQIFYDLHEKISQSQRIYAGYNAAEDPEVMAAVETLKKLVQSGANPDAYRGNGITFLSATTMTAFHAAIMLAHETNRPDLVQTFLDAGADPLLKAPDGWNGMDYVLSCMIYAQDISRSKIDNAVRMIQLLQSKGAVLSDAKTMVAASQGNLKTHANLAKNLVGLDVLYQAGLVTDAQYNLMLHGPSALTTATKNMTTVTAQSITARGGQVLDYIDEPPGGPEPYTVLAGDTLWSLAQRYQHVMKAASIPAAIRKIAALNQITLNEQDEASRPLKIGERLLLPVDPTVQLKDTTIEIPRTLLKLAEEMAPVYYNRTFDKKQIADDIVHMNRLDLNTLDQDGKLKKGTILHIAIQNDGILHPHQKTPPARFKKPHEVDLIVIEPEDPHARKTYRVATSVAYAINPTVDLSQFHPLAGRLSRGPTADLSEFLQMVLYTEHSPIHDRIVFSHSMAFQIQESAADTARRQRPVDSVLYENTRIEVRMLERTNPVIFNAAGNFWPHEGRYIQSYGVTHSPRAVLIGAAGRYSLDKNSQDAQLIAPYSTHGADVCAMLPAYMQKQMEGTSYSTPTSAALYRQMSEWYGDALSFEEIMAAAFMTASRDVLDYADLAEARIIPPRTKRDTTPTPATFRTNGGGLPINERCGAGILNPEGWQNALDRLTELKGAAPKDAGHRYTLNAGAPVIVPDTLTGRRAEYVYSIQIPADMTLGKLTFMVPQGLDKRSEMMVRTPSGHEKHLPKSITDIISTFAFAYEDVKAGQTIQIITTEKLGDSAALILRGHAPGNSIALLRDELQQQGILPPANRTMVGATVSGPSEPLDVLHTAPQPITLRILPSP